MFTGIVEELGHAVQLRETSDAAVLTVRGPLVTSDARPGDSISVSGVCLTVVATAGEEFTADVMKETLARSSLAALRPGDPVNLERAATLQTRLGGHLVQGHVDGVGTIVERTPGAVLAGPDGPAPYAIDSENRRVDAAPAPGAWESVRFSLPAELSRYVVEKGSITVDGISLTVIDVDDSSFSVGLIPTTLALTTLGHKRPGDPVNLEVDVVAKYVEKLVGGQNRG